ncbi:MAG: hypothetical protein H7Y00_05505 [Fimbriimonadaceae bacterium]|nr:hypothetical protein [Chitinophagales bacterium]
MEKKFFSYNSNGTLKYQSIFKEISLQGRTEIFTDTILYFQKTNKLTIGISKNIFTEQTLNEMLGEYNKFMLNSEYKDLEVTFLKTTYEFTNKPFNSIFIYDTNENIILDYDFTTCNLVIYGYDLMGRETSSEDYDDCLNYKSNFPNVLDYNPYQKSASEYTDDNKKITLFYDFKRESNGYVFAWKNEMIEKYNKFGLIKSISTNTLYSEGFKDRYQIKYKYEYFD